MRGSRSSREAKQLRLANAGGSALQWLLAHPSRLADSQALLDQAGPWSYRETLAAARALAARLAAHRVTANAVVVIVAERCAALVVCMLAAWLAHARFIVIERGRFNRQAVAGLTRLQPACWLFIASDAGDDGAAGDACQPSIRVPKDKAALLEEWSDVPRDAAAAVPTSNPSGEAGAYLIWTSGTTGNPKIVATRHACLVNFLHWYIAEFGFDERDRFCMLSGLMHDPLLRDVLTPLSVGACVCIPTEAQRRNATALFAWLQRHQPTVIHATPALFDALARSGIAARTESVRLLAFGGEPLQLSQVELARQMFPRAQLVNCYGATETPQVMAFHRVSAEQHEQRTVPIGQPIPGVELLIINERNLLCDVDEPGEILVRSAYLADGYAGDPEQTRARFTANPFTGDPLDRVFRTGDAAVRAANGSIHVLGRLDRCLKLDGVRVDLDQLACELALMPQVVRAAAMFDDQQRELVAVIEPRPGVHLLPAQVRDWMLERGPPQAVPVKVVMVQQWPLTPNGKLDYAALRAQAVPDATRNAVLLESRLVEIWMHELGVAQLDVHASFQSLGGESLAASRIAQRLQRELVLQVLPQDLYVHPTLHELALHLSGTARPLQASLAQHVSNRNRTIERARRMRKESA